MFMKVMEAPMKANRDSVINILNPATIKYTSTSETTMEEDTTVDKEEKAKRLKTLYKEREDKINKIIEKEKKIAMEEYEEEDDFYFHPL